MLMEGSTVREGRYKDHIRKATDWLLDKSQKQNQRDGLIFSEQATEAGRYMYGHGFATLFLACVYGEEEVRERREKMKDILTRAVRYIANAQSSKGGYFYILRVEGNDADEGSVTVTQLQALRACRNAGISVPKNVIDKAGKYLKDSTTPDGGVRYQLGDGGPGKPALTAAAISCLFSAGEYKNKYIQDWFKFCKRNQIDKGEVSIWHYEYTHYYFAQALYSLGDDGWEKMFPGTPANERMTWTAYRNAVFDNLMRTQNADGSFPGGGGFIKVGPVYSTALLATILQLDRGVVPFYQRAIGKSD